MKRCEGKIIENWHTYQCSRNAQPGKDYCKTHDPEIISAKDAAREAKWKAQANERQSLRELLPEGWQVVEVRTGYYMVESPSMTAEQVRAFITAHCK